MPEDDASIQRLANIVLRDHALTLKVLRTANSAYYKRSDKSIQSATHAMLLSLLTANHARELAMRRRLPDPEEAHLCGMFRNLGEVLIAGYFPREYSRIIQHLEMKNRGEGIACVDVLGFRYEELGEAMAKHWGMPESVITGIRADGALSSSEIGLIASFAHELTAAVYRRESEPKRDGVAEVLSRYAKQLKLTRDEIAEILDASLAETRELFASAKVTIDDLELRRLQKAAMATLGRWGPPAEVVQRLTAHDATPAQVAEIDALTEQAKVREEIAAEVLRVAQPASGEDLNRVILMVLEGIFRGGPFDRVVFCMMTPDRMGVKARYRLGTGEEQLLEQCTFELTPREGPVAVAMLRRQSVCVPVERDFTAQELRFAQSLGASSFGVFPVVVGTRLVGCVYCDRPWNSRLPDRGTLAYVRKLCEGAVKGIEARQAAHTPGRATQSGGQAVLRLLRGEPAATVSAELGIAEPVLEKWRKEFMAGAVAGMRAG